MEISAWRRTKAPMLSYGLHVCVCGGGGGREEGGGGCACAGAVCVYVSDPRGSGVDDGLKALALRPNTVSKET